MVDFKGDSKTIIMFTILHILAASEAVNNHEIVKRSVSKPNFINRMSSKVFPLATVLALTGIAGVGAAGVYHYNTERSSKKKTLESPELSPHAAPPSEPIQSSHSIASSINSPQQNGVDQTLGTATSTGVNMPVPPGMAVAQSPGCLLYTSPSPRD